MKVALITGTSKGLGESVASLLMESGINVYGISRSKNEKLSVIAEENHVVFEHFHCDLGNIPMIEKVLDQISDQIFTDELTELYLINNAAVLEPINQVLNIEANDFIHHVNVNTIAPILLMNYFLKKSTKNKISFIGLNITSGAAERPIYGWSAYCSTKASINMYTETVALEQEELKTGHKVIAFDPGVMDTQMQEDIRSSSYDEFIEVENFRELYRNNILRDPLTVAQVLVDIITNTEQIENGKVYEVKDYL